MMSTEQTSEPVVKSIVYESNMFSNNTVKKVKVKLFLPSYSPWGCAGTCTRDAIAPVVSMVINPWCHQKLCAETCFNSTNNAINVIISYYQEHITYQIIPFEVKLWRCRLAKESQQTRSSERRSRKKSKTRPIKMAAGRANGVLGRYVYLFSCLLSIPRQLNFLLAACPVNTFTIEWWCWIPTHSIRLAKLCHDI